MPRALPAVLATALLLAPGGSTPAADPSAAIAKARQHLDDGDGRRAASLFEDALPGATAETRPVILGGLRKAYALAIRQAEADGDLDAARVYRENLAIIEGRPGSAETSGADLAANGLPAEAESAPAAGREDEPGDAPAGPEPGAEPADSDGPGTTEDSSATVADGPPAPPEPLSDGRPTPPADAPPSSEAASDTKTGLPPRSEESRPSDATTDNPEPSPAPPSTAAAIAAADAAFLARKYDEAGRLYAELAKSGRLPEVRRDPWAYCRMVDVVRRINAGPRSAQEWAEIQREIAEIRTLSPRNWYAEYLRNLAAELSTRPRRPAPSGMVLRGASPDDARGEPTTPTPKPAPENPADRRVDGRPAPAESPEPAPGTVGRRGQPQNNWQLWETTNFRIFHLDESLARQVARAAEAARAEQQARWSGAAVNPPWQPRCDIYLYPDGAAFSQMTGQSAESPGFSTMALNGGRVTLRRVNLRADHPKLVQAVLPHEITHVVLADLFPSLQIPRWADEGMAVLSEPPSEQDLRAADLAEPLADDRLFKVSDLMTMDYPDAQHWALYYAQSVSLTRFLVELGTPTQFIEFVRAAQRNGIEPELKRVYGIDGFEDLQARWREHARAQTTAIASRNAGTDTTGDDATTTRR